MEYIKSALNTVSSFFGSLDYSILTGLMDLNDARNIMAIIGGVFVIKTAISKLGHAAVCRAKISHRLNRATGVTDISIANLKDKPLIVYQIIARFAKSKSFITLKEFSPPLVVDGLKATSVVIDDFSSLNSSLNPFSDLSDRMDILLLTNDAIFKAKRAKAPEQFIAKATRGHTEITKSTKMLNGKVYTDDAAYALSYEHEGKLCISFLLKHGFIVDDWPFHINAIPRESMQSKESLEEALSALSEEIRTPIHAHKLGS